MTHRQHLLSALLAHWHAKDLGTTSVTLDLPIEGISSPHELRTVVREAERLLYLEVVEECLGASGLVLVVNLTVRGQEVFGVEA